MLVCDIRGNGEEKGGSQIHFRRFSCTTPCLIGILYLYLLHAYIICLNTNWPFFVEKEGSIFFVFQVLPSKFYLFKNLCLTCDIIIWLYLQFLSVLDVLNIWLYLETIWNKTYLKEQYVILVPKYAKLMALFYLCEEISVRIHEKHRFKFLAYLIC